MMRLSPTAQWRWQVAARALIAVLGGYALTALASARLAVLCTLWMAREDAALTGMLMSFALYAATILWTFSASTLRRACSWLLLAAGLLLILH